MHYYDCYYYIKYINLFSGKVPMFIVTDMSSAEGPHPEYIKSNKSHRHKPTILRSRSP